MRAPVVLLLGPGREALSGVTTHINLLLGSKLREEFNLAHFRVGSEGRSETKAGRLLRLVASPFLLGAAIIRRGVAIVHLNTSLNARAYWRDLAYLVVAKLCGARVVYQVHGGALPQRFFGARRSLAALLRATLKLPDIVVVLAQRELEAYRAFAPERQVVILPNGIDCGPYFKHARARTDPTAPLGLIYVGRLAWDKGLYEALRGLRLARSLGVGARLVIVGSGPEDARLQQYVRELDLVDDVRFAGPARGEHKIALLGKADVLLLPSYGEGLPFALLEAMAAGVPVIATRVGAIPDVMTEGVHGLFVPPRNPDAIAGAIAELAADRKRLVRMSAVCRERIATAYSIERAADELSRLYRALHAPSETSDVRNRRLDRSA